MNPFAQPALTQRTTGHRHRWISVAATALLIPTAAGAQYLDPGAASIIIQAVVAGVVAVGAGIKLYWSKISGFFSRRRRPDRPE
jgi:hypothetical protein